MGEFVYSVLKYVMLWESVRNSIEYLISLEKIGDCLRKAKFSVLELSTQLACFVCLELSLLF